LTLRPFLFSTRCRHNAPRERHGCRVAWRAKNYSRYPLTIPGQGKSLVRDGRTRSLERLAIMEDADAWPRPQDDPTGEPWIGDDPRGDSYDPASRKAESGSSLRLGLTRQIRAGSGPLSLSSFSTIPTPPKLGTPGTGLRELDAQPFG
jgi:hypothetical protein